ncbi:MAG TPA: mechanosensitive ion channel family protein [Opitutus sp.]|nr:mechanosensitive ion channel family protein [Opitutus sp.]
MNFEMPDFSELMPVLLAALPAAIAIIVGAVLLNFVLGRALVFVARRTSFTDREIAPVRRAMKWTISIAALIFALGAFGLNIGGVWGVLSTILAMVAIGFVAVWSVLSNTLCTLIIMLFRPFSVGDEVEIAGEPIKGRVSDLNFIYTTLDAGDGTVLQVPNNLFFQKVIRRRHAAVNAVSPADHLREKQAAADATPGNLREAGATA